MLPTIELGPWQVSTYGLLGAVAVLLGGMYSFHRLLRLDLPSPIIVRGFALTIAAGAVSPFLVYALPHLRHALLPSSPEPTEGLSITWALVGGVIVAAAYCRHHHISLSRPLDLGLLPVPLGLAIGRLGCFAAGCCAGKPTDSWLGVYLRDADGVWAVRYPTQLWSAAADLLIFLTLVVAERVGSRRIKGQTWPFDSFLALLLLGLYSLKRFLIAFVRESAIPLIGPLGAMHLYALAGLVVFTLLMIRNLVSSQKLGIGVFARGDAARKYPNLRFFEKMRNLGKKTDRSA